MLRTFAGGRLLVAGLLAGIAAAPMAAAQTLTMGVRAGPESIDPHWSTLGSHAEALRHVFDTLVGTDENLQLEPSLAVSWTPVEDDLWEFKLREGVKFHDGSTMTAEDVKFSIDRIPVVTGPMSMTIYTKSVKEAIVVDDLTLHVRTNGPAPTLPNDFIRLFVVPAAIGMDARNEEFNDGSAAIGTGPFRLVSWEPKGDFVVERFEDHWRGPAHWERVIRKEIPNDPARVAALKSGQVDIINYVPATDYASMQRDSSLDTFIGDSVYILDIYFRFDETLPTKARVDGSEIDANPFLDARVREAFDLAINRDALVSVVLEGLGKPANQLMPPDFFGGSMDLPARPYDPDRARALLAEAGYPNGFGMDFFCTNNRLPGDSAVCEALGQMWARVGLQINPQAQNGTVFFPAVARQEYSLWMSGWGTLTGEAGYTYGSLVHTNDPVTGLGAFNRAGYSNPDLDALVQKASRELDADTRRGLFKEVTEVSMNERILIPTVQLQTVWAARAGALDFTPRIDQETLAHLISAK